MRRIRVGGASGYWGESDMAVPQFLAAGGLDYIVFDYLAEVTMSILARARLADPATGYAADFVSAVLRPNIRSIASAGIKIISNAGGVNPEACAEAVRAVVAEAGLALKVAVVTGDDVLPLLGSLTETREMFSNAAFPPSDRVASANAYLGAFPIAAALTAGADIVITGRCVDSAVTLGACIHEFGWDRDDLDCLAGGSLAGHILECGPQATGGNFTDWRDVAGRMADVGYPIAEIAADGSTVITKPADTGGAVTPATVAEQMLYEIGDPQAYRLPDVVCDFSRVHIAALDGNRVLVSGARGYPAPDTYKVSLTWNDGWRGGLLLFFIGDDAADKARSFAQAAIARARAKLRAAQAPDFDEVLVETLGDDSHYGGFTRPDARAAREITLKLAAKHREACGVARLLQEATGLALAAPAGLAMFSGGRPKPSPLTRLFLFLLPKDAVSIMVDCDGRNYRLATEPGLAFDDAAIDRAAPPVPPPCAESPLIEMPLSRLAWGRSGDKGNHANIGILPRNPGFVPWIWQAVDEAAVAARFAHFLEGKVERFYLPGTGAINFLLHDVLGGGGVASLRNDPQGKSYAQILLAMPVAIPCSLVEMAR